MFSKNKIIVIIFFLVVLLNIFLLSICNRCSTLNLILNRSVLIVVAPFQDYTHNLISSFLKSIDHYVFLVSIAKENELLKKELELKVKVEDELIEANITNLRLRNLLDLKKKNPQIFIAAEVISSNPLSMSRTIIINKGSNNGIEKNFPVVSGRGIVGLVTEVVSEYSKVLLITDPLNSIDAFIKGSGIRGIVKGCGKNVCSLEYFPKKCDVKIGELIVSSGLDGVFPRGVRIGVVSKVINSDSIIQKVFIDPCVDLSSILEILVVIPSYNPIDDF